MAATTWNPADLLRVSLSNGNLTYTGTTNQGGVRSTTSHGTGKYHYEGTITTNVSSDTGFGLSVTGAVLSSLASNGSGGVVCFTDFSSGAIFINGSSSGTSLGNAANGDVIAVEIDTTGKLFWAARNAGNWNNSGTASPATGTGGLSFSALTAPFFVAGTNSSGTVVTANFGATTFSRAISSGFSAWDSAASSVAGMLFGG